MYVGEYLGIWVLRFLKVVVAVLTFSGAVCKHSDSSSASPTLSHSGACGLVSHCALNLHFDLDSFFGEVSVKEASTFFFFFFFPRSIACLFRIALREEWCVGFRCESPVRPCVPHVFCPSLWIAFSPS